MGDAELVAAVVEAVSVVVVEAVSVVEVSTRIIHCILKNHFLMDQTAIDFMSWR